MLSAAQLAVSEQTPAVPPMVTVLPEFEQSPPEVMDAVVLALVVLATRNEELYAAIAGAPVKVTVGVALIAVVDWFAVAEI